MSKKDEYSALKQATRLAFSELATLRRVVKQEAAKSAKEGHSSKLSKSGQKKTTR